MFFYDATTLYFEEVSKSRHIHEIFKFEGLDPKGAQAAYAVGYIMASKVANKKIKRKTRHDQHKKDKWELSSQERADSILFGCEQCAQDGKRKDIPECFSVLPTGIWSTNTYFDPHTTSVEGASSNHGAIEKCAGKWQILHSCGFV